MAEHFDTADYGSDLFEQETIIENGVKKSTGELRPNREALEKKRDQYIDEAIQEVAAKYSEKFLYDGWTPSPGNSIMFLNDVKACLFKAHGIDHVLPEFEKPIDPLVNPDKVLSAQNKRTEIADTYTDRIIKYRIEKKYGKVFKDTIFEDLQNL